MEYIGKHRVSIDWGTTVIDENTCIGYIQYATDGLASGRSKFLLIFRGLSVHTIFIVSIFVPPSFIATVVEFGSNSVSTGHG